MSEYKDLDIALERAKAEINGQFSPDAAEALRKRLLADLEALFKERIEALEAFKSLGPDIYLKEVLAFKTRVIEAFRDYDNLAITWREFSLKHFRGDNTQWLLPPGLWRLLILAIPVGPDEALTEGDARGLSSEALKGRNVSGPRWLMG